MLTAGVKNGDVQDCPNRCSGCFRQPKASSCAAVLPWSSSGAGSDQLCYSVHQLVLDTMASCTRPRRTKETAPLFGASGLITKRSEYSEATRTMPIDVGRKKEDRQCQERSPTSHDCSRARTQLSLLFFKRPRNLCSRLRCGEKSRSHRSKRVPSKWYTSRTSVRCKTLLRPLQRTWVLEILDVRVRQR